MAYGCMCLPLLEILIFTLFLFFINSNLVETRAHPGGFFWAFLWLRRWGWEPRLWMWKPPHSSHSFAFLPHAQLANQQSINILLFANYFRTCWHTRSCFWQLHVADLMVSGQTKMTVTGDDDVSESIPESGAGASALVQIRC